jgi:glyoxylase-like metal-dependent hydrolase (beta-lactamase superfamily II)
MRLSISVLLVFSLPAFAGPKLYVFDCGLLSLDSVEIFNLAEDDTHVRELFVPCYLIEHDEGRMLWDGGLPLTYAEAEGPTAIDGGSVSYDRSVVEQLADMGIAPGDIDVVAYSHLHWDHAGTANTFIESEILMQKAEWEAAMGVGGEFVDTSLFDKLVDASVTFVEGDHDVFGDGSVRMIFTPGHTPGHQTLLISLQNTGPLMLSGDLYHFRANRRLRRPPNFNVDGAQTLESMDRLEEVLEETGATLWIEHDKALADTLRKAPAFYD